MIVQAIKTHKITSKDKDILRVLDKYIVSLEENSVVAVTSKIISICEHSILKIENPVDEQNSSAKKEELIRENSQYYLPRASSKYNISFTITNNILSASAGIDESNGNGFYILWPKEPFGSANKIREFLRKKFGVKKLGVIITDSKTTPLRWGVTGFALSYSGIKPVKNYIGEMDLFGREFEYTKTSIIDGLASSAVLVMGEGVEQTPIATIEDVPFVEFSDEDPSPEEIAGLKIDAKDDLYAPLLTSVNWQKGKS